ncbi:hypothetical protein BDP81DRAFT_419523 [Colletotrichum phormii]|uniref:Uncharacterized protein n=1 Tax=Colletotrichum phormii TaxID=359342 RepID=A0AAI9ZXV0_9PEZI|nr:uncharacterized protein BDP81DRAFT_419523 [Colletotrichum phormii]KAK1640186.1 hypothetical protein BDP81DRAFT_419523 [Colletotrichum phormii]
MLTPHTSHRFTPLTHLQVTTACHWITTLLTTTTTIYFFFFLLLCQSHPHSQFTLLSLASFLLANPFASVILLLTPDRGASCFAIPRSYCIRLVDGVTRC